MTPYLLGGSVECLDKLGNNGFDLGVAGLQVLSQGAHKDDYTLSHCVIAGMIRGSVQELLKHWQEAVHCLL